MNSLLFVFYNKKTTHILGEKKHISKSSPGGAVSLSSAHVRPQQKTTPHNLPITPFQPPYWTELCG
jgi:hypothetical protein